VKKKLAIIGVGLEKSGTTSAFDILKLSKKISSPSIKETFFFNKEYIEGDVAYKNLYKNKDGKKFHLDITPSYYRVPGTYTRINNFFKKKLVVLFLRDPIHRALSHYWHDIRHHKIIDFPKIDIPNFEDLAKSFNYYFVSINEVVSQLRNSFNNDELLICYISDIKNGKFINKIEEKIGESLEISFEEKVSNPRQPIHITSNQLENIIIKRPSYKNNIEIEVNNDNYQEIVYGLCKFNNLKKAISKDEYYEIKHNLYSKIRFEELGINPSKLFENRPYQIDI